MRTMKYDKCYAWITENKTEKMFRQFFISITVKVSKRYPCMQYMGPIIYSKFNIFHNHSIFIAITVAYLKNFNIMLPLCDF